MRKPQKKGILDEKNPGILWPIKRWSNLKLSIVNWYRFKLFKYLFKLLFLISSDLQSSFESYLLPRDPRHGCANGAGHEDNRFSFLHVCRRETFHELRRDHLLLLDDGQVALERCFRQLCSWRRRSRHQRPLGSRWWSSGSCCLTH